MVTGHLSWEALAHELFEQELRRIDSGDGVRDPALNNADHIEHAAHAESAPGANLESVMDVGTRLDAVEANDSDVNGSVGATTATRTAEPAVTSEARRRPSINHSPYWLLPELVQLLAESRDRPVAELESAIRELITEQQFIDTAGDPVAEDQHDEHDQAVQLYVRVFIRVLGQLRERTREAGVWSDMPTTPQMFG